MCDLIDYHIRVPRADCNTDRVFGVDWVDAGRILFQSFAAINAGHVIMCPCEIIPYDQIKMMDAFGIFFSIS